MVVKNRVLLTLSILLVLAGAGLAFLSHAPNRLISGQGIMLISLITGPVLWLLAPILGLIIFAFLTPSIALYWLIILFAELLLLGLLLLAGATATQLAGGEESLVRTSLGGGFWLMSGVSLLIAIDSLSRVIAHPVWRSLAIALLMLPIIQTIPSIALFGLLIAPLSGLAAAIPWLAELGIGGIGLAPAIIALVLYALLPLVRNVVAGLEAVPDSVVESAKGMGMTRQQLFFRVQMPIAMPLILSGVRIIAVQTVGLAVVAALIGAGGLGAIVFQGLLSSALDLVLLGVIPVIAMAVIVDSLFKFIVIFMDISRR